MMALRGTIHITQLRHYGQPIQHPIKMMRHLCTLLRRTVLNLSATRPPVLWLSARFSSLVSIHQIAKSSLFLSCWCSYLQCQRSAPRHRRPAPHPTFPPNARPFVITAPTKSISRSLLSSTCFWLLITSPGSRGWQIANRRLQATSYRLQDVCYMLHATGHRPQATGHRLQVTGYRLQATGHMPQATSHKPQATGYRLQATGYRLQATGYRLQATGYRLQATGYRLQTETWYLGYMVALG